MFFFDTRCFLCQRTGCDRFFLKLSGKIEKKRGSCGGRTLESHRTLEIFLPEKFHGVCAQAPSVAILGAEMTLKNPVLDIVRDDLGVPDLKAEQLVFDDGGQADHISVA